MVASLWLAASLDSGKGGTDGESADGKRVSFTLQAWFGMECNLQAEQPGDTMCLEKPYGPTPHGHLNRASGPTPVPSPGGTAGDLPDCDGE